MITPVLANRAPLTSAALALFVLLFAAAVRGDGPALSVGPAPAGVAPNPDYSVRVRLTGGEWKDVFVYPVLVVKEFRGNESGHDDHVVSPASIAMFDFRGEAEVEVRVAYAAPSRFTIRPLSRNVTGELDGSTIRFSLNHPAKLVLAVNGDRARELHLFASAPESHVPTTSSANVKYFGPGVHWLDPFEYKLTSNETVYLAAGAVVHGQFTCDHVRNATIRGRGIIDQSDRFTPGGRRGATGISLLNSQDVTVDGITIVDAEGYHVQVGQSRNVTIRDTNSFSVSQWADGIDAMSSSQLKIQNVFVRSSDDSIALYCGRWTFAGDSRDISVTDSTLWADVAHPIFMGIHATPGSHERLERVRFKNIDILEHNQPGPGYQGCMAINAGDSITVHDVTFEQVRVEPFTQGELFNLKIFRNGAYNQDPGREISDILFRDVSYTGTGDRPSEIDGFDESRLVENVRFENLRVNGKLITGAAAGNIVVGPHTRKVEFVGPPATR